MLVDLNLQRSQNPPDILKTNNAKLRQGTFESSTNGQRRAPPGLCRGVAGPRRRPWKPDLSQAPPSSQSIGALEDLGPGQVHGAAFEST